MYRVIEYRPDKAHVGCCSPQCHQARRGNREVQLTQSLRHNANLDPSIKKTDAAKLQDEYQKLVEGLQDSDDTHAIEDSFMASPGQ
jgi:hypothetical protein